MTRMEIDLPVARLSRLARIAECEIPSCWPFDTKPQFIAGSCVHFIHRQSPLATATAVQLQVPAGARDPWYIWLEDFSWVQGSC